MRILIVLSCLMLSACHQVGRIIRYDPATGRKIVEVVQPPFADSPATLTSATQPGEQPGASTGAASPEAQKAAGSAEAASTQARTRVVMGFLLILLGIGLLILPKMFPAVGLLATAPSWASVICIVIGIVCMVTPTLSQEVVFGLGAFGMVGLLIAWMHNHAQQNPPSTTKGN